MVTIHRNESKCFTAFSARTDCPLNKQSVSGRCVTAVWNGIPSMLLEEFLLGFLKSLMQSISKIKHFVWARTMSSSVLVLSGANAMCWIPPRHGVYLSTFFTWPMRCKHFKKVYEFYPSVCSFPVLFCHSIECQKHVKNIVIFIRYLA